MTTNTNTKPAFTNAQGINAHEHQCRNRDERCPRTDWFIQDMRGASDFSRCTFNLVLRAAFTTADGWSFEREMPTMVLIASVSELRGIVNDMLHEGAMFAGADNVWVDAMRVDGAL